MIDTPSIRVLLVEDNAGDARLVREHLADAPGAQGFTLEDCPSLAVAGAAFTRTPPDVVLLDLSLPDSFGLETLRRWQALAPTLPVIVLTGSDDEAMAVAAVREGAQDYLVKGRIDGNLLAQAIRYAIERKRGQEALRLINDDLERRVEERTGELRETNRRLETEIAEKTLAQQQAAEGLAREQQARREVEAANRSKDEFLAILSHELRTPLNAILGWSEILRSGESDRAEITEGMEVIERNARAQVRLVEDVLEISRIICGKIHLKWESVDLPAVIGAATASARPAAAAKNIELRLQIEAMPTAILGDADRIQQVIWNLLSNAIKFTPENGHVTIRTLRVGEQSAVEITDDGIGIKADFLPFVFERFRQSDGSITRAHGGLGLGLSITRHLTEMHGGNVTVESEGEGRGAKFTVFLPVATPDHPAREESPAGPGRAPADALGTAPSLQNCRVLVVDDEADSRRVLVHHLKRAHAQVREAGSVAAALETLAGWDADVLVSDIAMPGQDGYSLLRRLRAAPDTRLRNLPAVALTAFVRSEDQAQALAAGFQMHLPKPFEPAAVLRAVATLAGR